MKLAEILSGPETWWRGWRQDPEGLLDDGRQCLMLGAATVEPNANPIRDASIPPGHRRMMRILGVASQSAAIAWNDAPERTWEEVAAMVEAYDRDRILNP